MAVAGLQRGVEASQPAYLKLEKPPGILEYYVPNVFGDDAGFHGDAGHEVEEDVVAVSLGRVFVRMSNLKEPKFKYLLCENNIET